VNPKTGLDAVEMRKNKNWKTYAEGREVEGKG
jgi:hypothetical protein